MPITNSNFDPPHREMGKHIASGIFNSGVLQAMRVLCQLASVVVLSRLLPPADFGVVAMVGPVTGFVALFQDFGFSQATVQKPSLRHEEVNAFFWLNIAISVALTAIIVAISPLVGWYYHEPRVIAFTAATGIFMFTGALGNQHTAILTRRMQFGLLAWIGTLGAVSGLVVSIIAALLMHKNGYWALYYGAIVGTLLPVIGVWVASKWRPTMPRWVPGLSHMVKFGAGVTASGVAGFVSGNMDNVLIGHRWGDHPLGLYDRSYKLLLFPLQRFVSPVSSTLIPVLSRLNNDPAWYRGTYLKALAQVTLAVWPGTIWSIVFADPLIPTLLGPQWVGAAPIFVPLAIAGLAQVISWTSSCLFISQGRTSELAYWSIFNAVTSIIAFVIGLPYGPVGVAIAYAANTYIFTPVYWWVLTRRGPIRFRDMLFAVLPQFFGGVVAACILFTLRHFVHAAPVILLPIGLILSYAVTALTMMLSARGRETLQQSLKAARRIFSHAVGEKEASS